MMQLRASILSFDVPNKDTKVLKYLKYTKYTQYMGSWNFVETKESISFATNSIKICAFFQTFKLWQLFWFSLC